MSPLSWFFISVACSTPLILLLRPSFLEFALMVGVDTLAFLVNKPIEKRVFTYLYPEVSFYFDGVDDQKFEALSSTQKTQILESFFRFPTRRAIFSYLGSSIKGIPAFCVVVFFWKHEISNTMQFAFILLISLVNFWYFYGAVFIESHIFLSKIIARLHEKFDLTEASEAAKISYSRYEFELQEVLTLFFIITFTLVLQWFVIHAGQYRSTGELAFKLVVIGLIGLTLFSRIWYLGRTYFVGGLEKIFKQMEKIDYKHARTVLPLHTSPLLARFEKTFNLLTRRLQASEQELSAVVFQEADKSRYRALGEMSALIAHDLSGPLHVAQFCVERLNENPGMISDPRYLGQLSTNLGRAIELITSLRARVKNPSSNVAGVKFFDAHHHVLRLLETQFASLGYKSIFFQVDPRLENSQFDLQRVDLIHILDNLYRNSVQNLLTNAVEQPRISIALKRQAERYVEVWISDNGTGLSREAFHNFTAFRFAQGGTAQFQEGLGLRLTRRLVELNTGDLTWIDPIENRGTTFCLRLRISESQRK